MKKIINKENINQVAFYQMPKAFFQETKYDEMSLLRKKKTIP